MKSRLDLPGERVDETILASFREIDPTIEIIYLGEGEWQVGSWEPPNRERRKRAHKLLEQQFEKSDEEQGRALILACKAALQGFRPITRYESWELRCGKALQEFRLADWMYRLNREQAYQSAESHAMHEASSEIEDKRRDEAIYRAKDAFRRGGRLHFTT